MSEVDKTRKIVEPFCGQNGIDLGSGGYPIVPWAIQFDLHRHERPPAPPVQFVASVTQLPFLSDTLNFVYASHILEDFPATEWPSILREWWRVLKPTGHMIIQIPEKGRFRAAVAAGQPDNLSHKHEGRVGELTDWCKPLSMCRILCDRCVPAEDYNILFIAQKL